MHPARRLLRLQEIDLDLVTIDRRLSEIDANIGETEGLRTARETMDSAKSELHGHEVALRDRELEVKSLVQKIEASEDQLYGGRVRNPKELKGLEEELDSFRRRQQAGEEAVLEAMERLEQLENALANSRSELERIDADWQSGQDALMTERTVLLTRRDQQQAERSAQVAAVGAHLPLYEDLRRRRAGRPVALLKDGVCQACGMALPTGEAQRARNSEELSLCSNCGRVLLAK